MGDEQAEYHITMGAAYLILYEVFFGQLAFFCIDFAKCAEAVLGLRYRNCKKLQENSLEYD